MKSLPASAAPTTCPRALRGPRAALRTLVALALVALLAPAPPVLAQAAPGEGDTLAHALLWRLDVPGAPAPSYVFGTIHLIDADEFVLSDSLMVALNRAERVVFEIDPQEMTNPMMAMGLMQRAMMPGDTSLRDLLSAEDYAAVDAHFSAMGLPMMFLDRVKPMFLSMLAGIDPSEMGGGLGGLFGADDGDAGDDDGPGIKSYELELDGIARAAGKQVGGLETTDFQLSLFDSIPLGAQAAMLLDAVNAEPSADGEDELTKITRVYTSGDVDGMYAMSVGGGEDGTGGAAGVAGFERMLIVNRNRNWIDPMRAQAGAGATLFAVGAGHLGGPEGVIRLLRATGATLTPLSQR